LFKQGIKMFFKKGEGEGGVICGKKSHWSLGKKSYWSLGRTGAGH
jgi:hypothetical protein